MTLVNIGEFFFKWRGQVLPLLMLLMLVVPPVQGSAFGIDEQLLDILGITAMLVGAAWRITVVGLKYIRRGGVQKKVYADNLVTGGIFSVCRNPLYVGNILIATGALLVHAQPLLLFPGVALIILIYVSIVAAEENFLLRKFGTGFVSYCADVNRWLPDLSRLPRAFAGTAFNIRRVIIKEYPTTGSVLIGILLLLADEVYWTDGSVPPTYWTAVLAVVALVLIARTAKKSGLMTE